MSLLKGGRLRDCRESVACKQGGIVRTAQVRIAWTGICHPNVIAKSKVLDRCRGILICVANIKSRQCRAGG